MALFHITIEKVIVRQDDELLKEINCKLNKLLAAQNNDEIINKAASDLDTSTNKLKEAIDKNTPQS